VTKGPRRRRWKRKEGPALLWATAVVGSAELPDARLGQRAVAILALKSGCRIEKTQMKTAERIKILLPFFSVVAARLVALTYWARTEPNAACTVALSDLEWRVAWQFTHKRRVPAGTPTPTIAEAVRMIGRMGGHLGRKGDGMPGLRSLWKGWRDLQLLADYHQTFR